MEIFKAIGWTIDHWHWWTILAGVTGCLRAAGWALNKLPNVFG